MILLTSLHHLFRLKNCLSEPPTPDEVVSAMIFSPYLTETRASRSGEIFFFFDTLPLFNSLIECFCA
jgi:hypothetical protein